MLKFILLNLFCLILILPSCDNGADHPVPPAEGTFGFDLNFLKKYDQPILLAAGEAQIIVSPKYQGKVFTSTAQGAEGRSFGWVNYKAFDGPADPHMNAFGGENRLWLGPEGGPFSLFFQPGATMEFKNWKTPAAYDNEPWKTGSRNDRTVTLIKDMQLKNYAGTDLKLTIHRKIQILDRQGIFSSMGLDQDTAVMVVGYSTENILTNTGDMEWTETTGMPCIWMLDMFRPSPETVILIPFDNPARESFDKVATTNYFGEIAADRIRHPDSLLFYKADGMSRGKLGIHPGKAKKVAGSYDVGNKVLTITLFDLEPGARYLNQEWSTAKSPFSGDAVNAYNDGPLGDGKQMGPFYEIESVSPAAFLKPGESMIHHHSVFHFTGSAPALDSIARKLLGVSLAGIKKIFTHA